MKVTISDETSDITRHNGIILIIITTVIFVPDNI